MSDSLFLLCVGAVFQRRTLAFIFSYLSVPDSQDHLSEEEDGSGNSCTIGSEIYLDVSYLHYLYDARLSISSCIRACRVWSARYDGEDPPPEKYQPGVLEESGLESQRTQTALKKGSQLLPWLNTRPSFLSSRDPHSITQPELEWDDSYDVCPVQTVETPVEGKLPHLPPSEPPKHIQEMRRTAIMLVKGSYIEENEFQDDVMVYDLVAKKDSSEVERTNSKPRGSPSEEAQPGPADVPLKGVLSLTLPTSVMTDDDKKTKVKVQTNCNGNLQNTTPAEMGVDFLAQYEELIRTLDTEAGGKQVTGDGELKTSATPVKNQKEEEEDMIDFSSFAVDTPEPEKVHSPFGTSQRTRSGSSTRCYSVPFTGEGFKRTALCFFVEHLHKSVSIF